MVRVGGWGGGGVGLVFNEVVEDGDRGGLWVRMSKGGGDGVRCFGPYESVSRYSRGRFARLVRIIATEGLKILDGSTRIGECI